MMHDTPEEAATRYRDVAYALQFTGASHEEYEALIQETYPEPRIEVDCATLDDYEAFFDAITDDLTTDPADYFADTSHVRDHFNSAEGSLILYNFDAMDEDSIQDMAMYIKGLAEVTPVNIALTVEDVEAVYRGNSDLSGRVRTVNFTDYES